ncbi:MAG TPA: hypothetical protein VFE50_06075 [Cyclobacteriaceae bacterium]|nr:hypothetical protein [Cyclobacteriaceae bacterium]
MKYKKLLFRLLIVFLLAPSTAFAHGEESFIPFLIDFGSLIIFCLVALRVNITDKGRLILIASYLVTLGVVNWWFITSVKYLDYIGNMATTNAIIIIVPLLVPTLVYITIRKKYR